MVLLKVTNISKSISIGKEKVIILKNLSLTVLENESIAITGKSGSGKTTLLHILGGLDSLDTGEVFFKNLSLCNLNKTHFHKYNVGFVFQNFYLLEDETVWKNILIPALIARKSVYKQSETYKRAKYLLEIVGLLEKEKVLAKNLSGGEKQRLSIARALINKPDILLADEPTGNLDSETSEYIHQVLLNCVSYEKTSLVVVTHNEKLSQVCSKQFILQDKSLQLVKQTK